MSLRLLRSILLGLLSVPALASAQTNDECSGATVIKNVPSRRTLAVDFATVGATDPPSSCTGSDANVWYTYTARSDVSLDLDTTGSSYAAAVSVYAGDCAALTESACNNDAPTHLIVQLRKGQTIRIAVTTDGGTSDETLALAVRKSTPRYREPERVAEVVRSSDASPYGGSQGQLLAAVAPSEKTTIFAQDTEAVVVDVGGVLTTIAASGDATPAGGTYVTFRPPVVSATAVYFSAVVEGGPVTAGIFKWNGTTVQPYLLPGDPGPVGSTLRSFGNRLAVSGNDVLAFLGRTTTDTHDRVLRYDGMTVTALATEGDAHPCGGALRGLPSALAIDQSGTTVVFNPTVGDAILTANGTTLAAIACDNAATPVGGTYRSFGSRPTINDLGEVYFTAGVANGPAAGDTVWASSGGAATLVASRNLVLATGQTIRRIPLNQQLATNAAGDVVFTAQFLSGRGLVRRPHLAPLPSAIVLSSDACPIGGHFGAFDDELGFSAAGDVVFDTDCDGGHGAFRKALAGDPVTVASLASPTAIGTGVNVGQLAIDGAGTRVAGRGFRVTLQSRTCAKGGCDAPVGLVEPRTPIANVAGQLVGSIFDGSFASSAKTIAFAAATVGTTSKNAVLRLEKGTVEAVASVGDPLPGGVGSFVDLATPDDFGGASTATIGVGTGVVAFHAVVEHPTASDGIFAATAKGLVTLALSGDPAPRGGTFGGLGLPTVRGKSIVFGAITELGTCIFGTPAAGKPLEAIACTGDPLPPPLAGTIDGFVESPSGSVHDLYAVAEVEPSNGECLLHFAKGSMTPVRCTDDLYPGGGFYDRFSGFGIAPQTDGKGKSLTFLADAYPDNLVLLSARKDTITRLLVPRVTPAPFGGKIGDLLFAAPSSSGGSVIATTTVDDGPARFGVFRFELP